jgi:ribonuclease R
VNLAVLKSLSRAEYSPQTIGHYALASEHYCHFTSPIRRYADLTIHRLLDSYFEATGARFDGDATRGSRGGRKSKPVLDDIPSDDDLVTLGRHISFTERRSEDAERELRKVKILELLSNHVGDEFTGIVTGITNFGLFVQLQEWLVDGLIRYEDLLDDWWDVDERGGMIRGERTGKRIRIGDVVKVIIAKVDLPRRQLDLSVTKLLSRGSTPQQVPSKKRNSTKEGDRNRDRGGSSRRARSTRSSGRRGR